MYASELTSGILSLLEGIKLSEFGDGASSRPRLLAKRPRMSQDHLQES